MRPCPAASAFLDTKLAPTEAAVQDLLAHVVGHRTPHANDRWVGVPGKMRLLVLHAGHAACLAACTVRSNDGHAARMQCAAFCAATSS